MRSIENPKVAWSGKGLQYTEEEISLVAAVMRDADPLTQGKHQQQFEARFKEYTGAKAAFAVSHCSAALQLSAMLTKIGPGDEVILPAHTFAATAIPFGRTGATLVWADIDPETRLISVKSIEQKISPRTKVIVVVHLYGLMADMDPIMEIARRHHLFVIEDAAQSAGASYKGKKAGSIGDLGCFSFHTHKNISTLGEGGMLTVNRPEWIDLIPGLRHNGMRPFSEPRDRYWIPTMTNVDFDWEGVWPYKFCLGEVQCALGSKLLERLDAISEKRRSRAQRFLAALSDFPELSFQKTPAGQDHVYHLLTAKYDGRAFGKTRDDFMELMAFTHKVQVIVQYYPLYRYPLFIRAGFGKADCPHTDDFYDNMVSFPFHHWLSEENVDYMIKAARSTLASLRG